MMQGKERVGRGESVKAGWLQRCLFQGNFMEAGVLGVHTQPNTRGGTKTFYHLCM